MKHMILVAGCAALALAACQKKSDGAINASDTAASDALTSTPSTAAPDGASGTAALTPALASAPAAPDFVAMAAASDMYEIQAAKIAEKRSKTQGVKAFAKRMMTDHAKSTAMVKKAVADSGRKDIMPPSALPADKQAMIDALNKASDADFDKTYLDQQTQAHKDAMALMTAYSMSGDVPQLKDAAGMIAPVVQMHMDMLAKLNSGAAG